MDILPGLNLALENELTVTVEEKYEENLTPNKKYVLKLPTIKKIIILVKGTVYQINKNGLASS